MAIADPTAYIPADSPLIDEVARRGTSVYFHGDVLPMLPEALSQDTCALSEGVDRPALVCKIAVSDSGEVGDFEFIEATVRSRAKLSYYAVDRYLTGQADDLMSHATPLEALYQVHRALRAHRETNELVMEDRREYRWILSEQKTIEAIEPYEKLLSQKLVEECMVATNRCAARLLAEHGASGPFVSHPGFRQDRLDEARKFLTMHAPELADVDLGSREGYRDVIKGLSSSRGALPLRAMVNRLLTRAALTTTSGAHMGMSLPAYTNCTSPLRRYLDFLVHLQIKSILHKEPAKLVTRETLDALAAKIATARAATDQAERWLAGRFLAEQAGEAGKTFKGYVAHVNSSGFNVKLADSGLGGFIDLRKDPEKFSYDKWTASLTSTSRRFQLEQLVELTFTGVDEDNNYQAEFKLVPGCGLKPPKEPPAPSKAAPSEGDVAENQ